jgi:uncharacterized protein
VQFNVSTLLQEPVGSTRVFEVSEGDVAVPADAYEGTVSGRVHMLRTARGVLVRANLEVEPTLECARCLEPYGLPLELRIEEEFFPQLDPATGEAVQADPDDFRIDDRNHLDLSEAVRQYEQAALPIQPVCRPDCAGLCPICGQNLNEHPHEHERPPAEAGWTDLASLAERLRAEEDRGRT